MIRHADLALTLEEIAPSTLAEAWDNVGWQLRCRDEAVAGVLCSVDATSAVIDEAADGGANVVLAHHPLLFRPLRALDASAPVGSVLARALQRGVSVVAAHTNWDAAPGGVSWALARALGLEPVGPLEPRPGQTGAGLGVLAEPAAPIAVHDLAIRLRQELDVQVMARVGRAGRHQRIALMGGSGASAIPRAVACGATLYITADVRYHEAQEAEALGLSLLIVDHGGSERPGMAELSRVLAERLPVPVALSNVPTSPWQ